MSKAYKVTRHKIKFDKKNIYTVFSVKPVNYGVLSTEEAAAQIAKESSLTEGDVLNVLNRYSSYVITGLRNGYAVELLGFGKIDIAFVKSSTVDDEKKATATLVKGMVPRFTPSFTLSGTNRSRVYDLIPQRIQLVKFDANTMTEEPSDGSDDTDTELPSDNPGTGSDVTDPGSGGTDSGSGVTDPGSGDTDSGSGGSSSGDPDFE